MGSSRTRAKRNLKDQYQSKQAEYDLFLRNIKSLLEVLLQERSVPVQAIQSRVKSWESVSDKAMQSPSKYGSLEDMEDVCGLRVILWSDDQIQEAGSVIEREFAAPGSEFDAPRPKIKDHSLMPDRFGYRSRHYVVSLSSSRADLPEYQRFKGFKAEVQVRSALQHVWAQIEHDIGYKGEVLLPSPITRRFARLAALLEIGDELIKDARSELDEYKEELPHRIERAPDGVPIDRRSLRLFLCGERVELELDKQLARVCATTIREEEPSQNRVMKMVRALSHANIATVGDLRSTLESLGHALVDLVDAWQKTYGGERLRNLTRGFSIWLLAVAMAAREMSSPDFHRLAELLELDLTFEESDWLTEKAKTLLASPPAA